MQISQIAGPSALYVDRVPGAGVGAARVLSQSRLAASNRQKRGVSEGVRALR